MFDMTKYDEIYNEMKNLDDETLMMIIENAETKEEKDFFCFGK